MIGILSNGPRMWASSRLRGFWYQDAAPDTFQVFGPDSSLAGLGEHEVVVFQKRQSQLDVEAALRFKAEGRTIVYDITDPIWWWKPEETNAMFRIADCVVCSNDGLASAVSQIPFVGRVEVIPDRMLPDYHPTTAQHKDKEPVVLAWYGANANRLPTLAGLLPVLGYLAHSKPIQLRIIDSSPQLKIAVEDQGILDIQYVPWTIETFHAQLIACDIALVPPYPGPWGQMKSNNKQATAWWCGLPAVTGYDMVELVQYIDDAQERSKTGAQMRAVAEREYDIAKSVEEWKALAGSLMGQSANGVAREIEGAVV